MTETALERAKRKFEQAKAALDAIKARESAVERKKDTRRKIVLGGALLELSKSDKEASALVTRLIAGLSRDHDKKLFEKSARRRKEGSGAPTGQRRDARRSARRRTGTLAGTAEDSVSCRRCPTTCRPPVRRDRDEI